MSETHSMITSQNYLKPIISKRVRNLLKPKLWLREHSNSETHVYSSSRQTLETQSSDTVYFRFSWYAAINACK